MQMVDTPQRSYVYFGGSLLHAGACPCCQVISYVNLLDTGVVEPAFFREIKRDTIEAVSFGWLNEFEDDGFYSCYTIIGSTFPTFRFENDVIT